MNQNQQYVLPRLRTLVEDVCGNGIPMSLPRLVIDVVEPQLLDTFTRTFNDEFDTMLHPSSIDDETTFRDLLNYIP